MARVFNRGELKLALLSVIASLGEGHGYAIMQELQRRVGSQWRPSPGAIYPALVALEEAGLIARRSARACASTGSRAAGAAELAGRDLEPSWRDISRRADARRPRVTLGRLLDRFELGLPRRVGPQPRAGREHRRRPHAHAQRYRQRSSKKEQSMDEFGKAALREREAVRIARRQWFWMDLIVWAAISVFLFVIWLLAGGGFPWFVIAVGAWGIVVVAHAAFAFVLRSPEDILLEREQKERERPVASATVE